MQNNTPLTMLDEDAFPNPEYLIKSIAEQGYSLETSLADLMDNSVSAKADKIEVLAETTKEPFRLFLADNGNGMSEKALVDSMQFPSESPDKERDRSDLGRFGLGMKTASFSQTRRFTVISRPKGTKKFHARTWDVDYLKTNGWKIIKHTDDEIQELLDSYYKLSGEYLNSFDCFEPNTIVVWSGLYKFESYIKEGNRKKALKKEINEVVSDHLSLVFHRFLESQISPLQIKINNTRVTPFNPFPITEKDVRQMEPRQRFLGYDVIKAEGFILPARAIEESKSGQSIWTTKFRGLMDMEGIYVYRGDRIILFGGWNGLIKKSTRLQLGRLRMEVGNKADHLLHLNVAKSQISVPYELQDAFEEYVIDIKTEAEREYYNRGIRKFSGKKKAKNTEFFIRSNSNKGTVLEINQEFPLIKDLQDSFTEEQLSKFNLLLRMFNTGINRMRQKHEEKDFAEIIEQDNIAPEQMQEMITVFLDNGFSKNEVRKDFLSQLGLNYSTLPDNIKKLLN